MRQHTAKHTAEEATIIRKAGQALLTKFLGVSVKPLRSWEQGTRPVPKIVGHHLDDIQSHLDNWHSKIRAISPDDCEK